MSISVQLDSEYLDRLSTRAGEEGISAEEFAKRIVMRALDDTKQDSSARTEIGVALSEVQRELAGMRLVLGQVSHGVNGELIKDIENFRRDFSVAVLALLVGAGRVDKEEAKEWVKENLRPLP